MEKVLEKYMFKKKANFNSWDSLNPTDFEYNTIDGSLSYSNTFVESAPFVNNYAQTSAAEDRASTFEYMMANTKASCLNGQLNEATELNQNLKAQLETLQNDIKENDKLLKQEDNVKLDNLPNNEKVEELEYQINSLTAEITKSEYLIKDQKETINELQETLDSQTQSLNEELKNIKNKYTNLLGSSKITEDYYDRDYNEKTVEFKKDMESNIYQLTKKLLNSNEDLKNKNIEKENLKFKCQNDIDNKNKEITELKNNIKNTQTNYELLYKLSIDQLGKYNDNYAKFKKHFFNREKDFVSVSNYYKDMMNQYNKPLLDQENPNNKLENEYHVNASQVINLQQENDSIYLEIENLKQKQFNKSGEIRKNISSNVFDNDNKISNIIKKQKDLAQKIKKFKTFYNDIIQKTQNIDKLSKDNKNIFNENKAIINKISTFFNNIGGENDMDGIKLKIKKLEIDSMYKEEYNKQYEENPLKYNLRKFADPYILLREEELTEETINEIQNNLDWTAELANRDIVSIPFCICLISKYPYV